MSGLTVDRRLAAPPERVWRALTDADALAGWFWPPRFAASARVEAREGGVFRVVSEPVGIGVTERVTAVDPSRLLATTWRWDGEDDETSVAFSLEPSTGGTLLTVRHDGFPTDDAAREHEQGWNDCLDRLPAALGA